MQIRIHEDARSRYIRKNAVCGLVYWDWAYLLGVLQGETLEVETEHLFQDQYNTGPIAEDQVEPLMARLNPCRSQQTRDYVHKILTGSGIRIMWGSVAEVIDDARPGMMRCQWCGKCSSVADTCPKCEKGEYLKPFPVVS